MALIQILRPNSTLDAVEESELEKLEGRNEDDNEIAEWVEYRFPGDPTIVHRSVHVTLKKWPEGMSGETAIFGS